MLCARGLIVIRVKVDSILLRGFDATSHKEKEFKKKKKEEPVASTPHCKI